MIQNNKRCRQLWPLMILITNIMHRKRNIRLLRQQGSILRPIKYYLLRLKPLVQRVLFRRMMFFPSLRVRTFRRVRKDLRLLLFKRKQHQQHLFPNKKLKANPLKSQFKVNQELLMECSIRQTFSSNLGLMRVSSHPRRPREKLSNQRRRAKLTLT